MKRKMIGIMAGIILLLSVIGAGVMFIPSAVSFSLQNHLSFSEGQAAFIHSRLAQALGACGDKQDEAAWLFLSEQLDSSLQLNDFYRSGGQTYVDLIQTVFGEPIHMIYNASAGGLQKYIDSASGVTINQDNRSLEVIKKNFASGIDISADQTLPYADPFAEKTALQFQKHKKPGLQEQILLEEQNRQVQLTVYETIEGAKSTNVIVTVYPAGTPLPVLAMANKTTPSVAAAWFGPDAFDQNGALKEDTRLCTQKQVSFRYGRQVGILPDNSTEELIVIDQWEEGTAKFALQQPFLVNFAEDSVDYDVIGRPPAMSLCDAYFKDHGLQAYYQLYGDTP